MSTMSASVSTSDTGAADQAEVVYLRAPVSLTGSTTLGVPGTAAVLRSTPWEPAHGAASGLSYLDRLRSRCPPGSRVFGDCPRPRMPKSQEKPMNGAGGREDANKGTGPAIVGHNSEAAEPLVGMTKKQIWLDCVWLSKERTATKIMLLCIGRFFDENAQSSSMSYAQVARECSLHEATPKRIAGEVRDRWLRIGVGKGFHVPGKGAQNLYHGLCPPELVEELCEYKRTGVRVEHDAAIEMAVERVANGVASGDPGHAAGSSQSTEVAANDPAQAQTGVASDDRGRPGLLAGSSQATCTPITPKEDSLSGARAPDASATSDLFSGGAPDQALAPSDGPVTWAKTSSCKPAPSTADIKLAFGLYLETAERCRLPKHERVDPWVPNIKARLREHGIDGWQRMLSKVEASPFLRGERTDFRADLDWLSGPKNFAKVLSGKYDDDRKSKPKKLTRY